MKECLNNPIKILVSSCLAGEAVRYDGEDSKNLKVLNHYSKHFKLQTICPEIAIGLGVPRNPISIIQDDKNCGNLYLIDKNDCTLNYTRSMLSYAKRQINDLQFICGYIVKERSPSCGLEQTPRFSTTGEIITHGAGLFTDQIMSNMPWLPIISESGLEDEKRQDNFLERLYILDIWNRIYKKNKQLDVFNTMIEHQVQLRGIKTLPKLINNPNQQQENDYIIKIMTILKVQITMKMQLNFLNRQLDALGISSKNMTTVLSNYQLQKIPLQNVLQQFKAIFSDNKITVDSNYFYPDEYEILSRVFYFDR